ncbi:hypothetical protein BKH18_12480 [Actinomyces oris]|nr:hypothetical protein BKH18_12480 [Actinomyces oris]
MDAWDRRGQRRPQGATAVSPAADPSAQRRRPIMAHFRPYCCKVCNQWPGSQPDIFRSTGRSPRQVADPASPPGDTIIAYPLCKNATDRSVRRREPLHRPHHPLREQDVAPAPQGCRGHAQRSVAAQPRTG